VAYRDSEISRSCELTEGETRADNMGLPVAARLLSVGGWRAGERAGTEYSAEVFEATTQGFGWRRTGEHDDGCFGRRPGGRFSGQPGLLQWHGFFLRGVPAPAWCGERRREQ
jgi:hypothetical protein